MIGMHLKLALVISCVALSSSGAQLANRVQFKDSLVAHLAETGALEFMTYSLEGDDSTIFVATAKVEMGETCPIYNCLDQMSTPGSLLNDLRMKRMGFSTTRVVSVDGEVWQRLVGGGRSKKHVTTYAERISGHHYFQRKVLIFKSQVAQDQAQRMINAGNADFASIRRYIACIAPAGQEYEVVSIGWFNLGYRQVEVVLHDKRTSGQTNEGCQGWTRRDLVSLTH